MTQAEVDKIREDVRELLSHFKGNVTKAAQACRVSRTALGNWRDGPDVPKGPNLARLRQALVAVREDATKVSPPRPPSLAPPRPNGLASPSLRGEVTPATKKEMKQMGALLARVRADEEPPYRLELEICLWYHREEIANGEISQTTIHAAKEGAFEDEGCATWSAKRWWSELQGRDRGVRDSMKLRRVDRSYDGSEDEDDDVSDLKN